MYVFIFLLILSTNIYPFDLKILTYFIHNLFSNTTVHIDSISTFSSLEIGPDSLQSKTQFLNFYFYIGWSSIYLTFHFIQWLHDYMYSYMYLFIFLLSLSTNICPFVLKILTNFIHTLFSNTTVHIDSISTFSSLEIGPDSLQHTIFELLFLY